MSFEFSSLDESRTHEAFEVLRCVGNWLDSRGIRQRISQTTIESYLQWQSEQANYVVSEGRQVIGLITIRQERLEDWPRFLDLGPVTMLRALATHPDFQGRGVGAFAIQQSLRRFNVQPIFLDCVSDTLPSYYARFGFESVDRQQKTYPDGDTYDITLMRRPGHS